MKIIDKLAWIEIKNGKILSTKSYGKEKYYIPGGKREGAESDVQALTREISEELQVQLIPDSIRYMGTFEAQADSHPFGTLVKMTCYKAGYTGELKASAEIEWLKWLSYSDLESVSAVDKIIFKQLKEQGELL
ncbi:NUDIX domain-containing protein [Sphingobacterium sp.]|uniref:NUDIX hydrolase n=1 Tax=Sphingobacterium sp. TaxID=341027 RepID=UPI0028A87659|nr:NUDIX domain-containing protein [Sphingobacterium sp.]